MTILARLLRVSLLGMLMPLAAAAGPYHYGEAELDQMLAPIALYPDSVLSHVLIAATYPDDVAEAARWTRRHPDLTGQTAVDAVSDRDWDASVKALVGFPEVLARMDEDPQWTSELGEAFLEQEGDVMDRVQVLRQRAYAEGHLDTEHTRIIREREVIYIEPAVTDVVYVPYYDPWFVYGSWWWSNYPPYCWHSWYGRPAGAYYPGFWWGVGFHVAPTFYFAAPRWPERQVVVVPPGPHNAGWHPLYSGHDAAHFDGIAAWRHEGPVGPHMTPHGGGRSWAPASRPSATGEMRPEHFPRRERHEPMDERIERRERHSDHREWQQDRREWQQDRREVAQDHRQWQHEEHRELRHQAPEPRGGRAPGYAPLREPSANAPAPRVENPGREQERREPQRRGPHEPQR